MKITYVTTYNAFDVQRWSGTGYYIAKMFENQNAEVEYLGNLNNRLKFIWKAKQILYKNLTGKIFLIHLEPYVQKQYAKQIELRLNKQTDVIFSAGTSPTAFLKTNKPKVFYTDATFAGMLGFYNDFSNFCGETIKYGHAMEQEALNSSSLAIYSSDWAAQTAIDNYKVDPDKVKIVPFGANISNKRNLDDIKNIIQNRSRETLNLLFLGVDWVRKGGERALNIAEYLNKNGIKTTLHIAGIDKLPLESIPDFVVNHGFISKRSKEGNDKIEQLIANSHFLIVPSIAEAYGLVFAEANAFGVPCLANKVGGIPTIIHDNINGKTFEIDSNIADWATFISENYSNDQRYRELCLSSFNEYENRLNWNVAGKTILNLMNQL